MTQIKELLSERQTTHGEIADNAELTMQFWSIMEKGINWKELSDSQKHALYMTQHKIARLLSGDPDFIDHWEDPAGYLTAIVARLRQGNKRVLSRVGLRKLVENEVYPPGTSEDGGHAVKATDQPTTLAQFLGGMPTLFHEPSDLMRDGEEREGWMTIELENYQFIINREYYSDAAIDHLPKLIPLLTAYEWEQLPPWYKVMYNTPASGKDYWTLKSHFNQRWT